MSGSKSSQRKPGQPVDQFYWRDDNNSSHQQAGTTDDSNYTSTTNTTDRSRRSDNNSRYRRPKRGERSRKNRKSKEKDRSNSQKRKYLNVENKTTTDTLILIQKKLKSFKRKRLGPSSDYAYDACAKCLEEEILPDWRMTPEDVRDSEDFLTLSLRKPTSEEVMESDEYMDLIGIAQRSQDFEILVPEARRRLATRLNDHVYSSCLSMHEESGGKTVTSAQEYQSHIDQYVSQLEAKNKEIEEGYRTFRALTKPFLEYVRAGQQHATCMSKLCNSLLEACKVVENWVKEDDCYPERLEKEMEDNGKKIDNMNDAILLHQEKIKENNDEIEKIRRSEGRAEKSYSDFKRDKERLKTRHADLLERKAIYDKKLVKKQDELDELKAERQQKGNMSPRESFDFLERLEAVERSIERLGRERKTTDRQIRRVEKDLKPTSDRTYEEKVDYVEQRNHRYEFEKDNRRRHRDIHDIRERIQAVKRQIEVIKNIRELKLSAEAYRKCQRQNRMRRIMESNGSQALTEACQYAAPSIGKDWKKLYLRLPFDPPRHADQRQRDVDNLDYFCARSDVTVDQQALKCLNKWRSFHRRGNVNDLVQSLKIMKKRAIASEIETRFAVTAA